MAFRAQATGTVRPYEKEYFRKDGSRVLVLIGEATFEEGGDEGVAFVLDLTQRHARRKRSDAAKLIWPNHRASATRAPQSLTRQELFIGRRKATEFGA